MKIDSAMKSSAMLVGYKILKEIRDKKVDHISIYDVSELLRKSGIYGSSLRQVCSRVDWCDEHY